MEIESIIIKRDSVTDVIMYDVFDDNGEWLAAFSDEADAINFKDMKEIQNQIIQIRPCSVNAYCVFDDNGEWLAAFSDEADAINFKDMKEIQGYQPTQFGPF